MIDRETIRIAEARTASHAAIFQIRAAEYDAIPAGRPIARAIAAAALRTERAALDWASRRLETIRRYAALEGIAGETRATVRPWEPEAIAAEVPAPIVVETAQDAPLAETPAPIAVETNPRSITCPRCAALPGQRCHKAGRPQTRNHDARTRAAQAAPAVETAPETYRLALANTIAADAAFYAAKKTGYRAAIEYAIQTREQAHAYHDRIYRATFTAV